MSVRLACVFAVATLIAVGLVGGVTYERQRRELEDAERPVHVELKGLAAPLDLYDLRGLRGRCAGRIPVRDGGRGDYADVALPLGVWVVDGKRVSEDCLAGEVRRLRSRELDAALAAPLPRLTNVRLRVRYPSLARDSGNLYGKVVGEEERAGSRLTRIALTSVDPADEATLATLLAGGTSSGAETGPSSRAPGNAERGSITRPVHGR